MSRSPSRPKVNAIAGAKINLVFENVVTNRLGVGQITIRNPLKRRHYFRGGMNVECAQPLREWASSSGIDVFPNVEHDSIITYTLGSTNPAALGKVKNGNEANFGDAGRVAATARLLNLSHVDGHG